MNRVATIPKTRQAFDAEQIEIILLRELDDNGNCGPERTQRERVCDRRWNERDVANDAKRHFECADGEHERFLD